MNLKLIAAFIAVLAVVLGSAAYNVGAAGSYKVHLPMLACPGCDGPAAQPTTPSVPTPEPTPDTSTYAARMVELVNGARAAVGCPAVTPNAILMRGAQEWSETMARTGNYVHSHGDYYRNLGYPGATVENIGPGETPDYAFEGQMTSPLHKRNLEWCYPTSDPSYNPARIYEVGVGYAEGYWTLVIGWRIP